MKKITMLITLLLVITQAKIKAEGNNYCAIIFVTTKSEKLAYCYEYKNNQEKCPDNWAVVKCSAMVSLLYSSFPPLHTKKKGSYTCYTYPASKDTNGFRCFHYHNL